MPPAKASRNGRPSIDANASPQSVVDGHHSSSSLNHTAAAIALFMQDTVNRQLEGDLEKFKADAVVRLNNSASEAQHLRQACQNNDARALVVENRMSSLEKVQSQELEALRIRLKEVHELQHSEKTHTQEKLEGLESALNLMGETQVNHTEQRTCAAQQVIREEQITRLEKQIEVLIQENQSLAQTIVAGASQFETFKDVMETRLREFEHDSRRRARFEAQSRRLRGRSKTPSESGRVRHSTCLDSGEKMRVESCSRRLVTPRSGKRTRQSRYGLHSPHPKKLRLLEATAPLMVPPLNKPVETPTEPAGQPCADYLTRLLTTDTLDDTVYAANMAAIADYWNGVNRHYKELERRRKKPKIIWPFIYRFIAGIKDEVFREWLEKMLARLLPAKVHLLPSRNISGTLIKATKKLTWEEVSYFVKDSRMPKNLYQGRLASWTTTSHDDGIWKVPLD